MAKKRKKQKFYKSGLQFECIQCGNCCTKSDGYVQLTEAEAESIRAHLNLETDVFKEKYLDNASPDNLGLKSRENGDCIFLIGEQCSIYQLRPKQCRTFPFWSENIKSEYRWNLVAEECPGIGSGKIWSGSAIEKIMTDEDDTGDYKAIEKM